jgi:preprotein translocase subunit YajC
VPFAILLQFPGANDLIGYVPMIAIFAIFYFLLFLPMQRQKKQAAAMLAALKTGDEVVTSGGIVGTIVAVNATDDTLVVRVKPDNVKLQMAKSAVANLVTKAEKAS